MIVELVRRIAWYTVAVVALLVLVGLIGAIVGPIGG